MNGVVFPKNNKGFVVSTTFIGGFTLDAFTYTDIASGITESNTMKFGTIGTYIIPVTVAGISMPSSATNTEIVILY